MSNSMAGALVSIIVPIYNSEEFLPRCLETVVNQHHQRIEILCVDDGSLDGSGKIAQHYAQRDPRVRIVKKANGGVSTARNAGLDVATGDFVMFIDSDDWTSPNLIGRLLKEFANGADLAMEGCSTNRDFVGEKQMMDFLYMGLRSGSLNSPIKMYRHDLIRSGKLRFDEDVSLGEDLLFNIEFVGSIDKVACVNDVMYHVRPVEGSLSRSYRPSKYQELALVHSRMGELLAKYADRRMESLRAYLKIKSLVSCVNNYYKPDYHGSRKYAHMRINEIVNANGKFDVVEGDSLMKIVGWGYRYLGLRWLARAVRTATLFMRLVPSRNRHVESA